MKNLLNRRKHNGQNILFGIARFDRLVCDMIDFVRFAIETNYESGRKIIFRFHFTMPPAKNQRFFAFVRRGF